ncbi:MAG: pitrilysin family protein [Kiritimatiellae bacterium]|nr:pitrilysin family protein [Kiritimatiellia bacterium]
MFRKKQKVIYLCDLCASAVKKSFALFAFGIILLSPCLSAKADGNPVNQRIERLSAGVRRHQLDNGLACIIKEDFSAPLVSIQIWVGAGSAQEGDLLGGGLSHLIEHMIFKGTARRKPADISREIDDAGGTINAYTSIDRTVFWVVMPSESWRTGLDVLADAVLNASFPENEWRREKEVVRREMAMGNDDPGRALSKLLFQTAYHAHPYRFPVIGLEPVFNTLTRDDLVAFFRRHYTPDNMIVAVAGNIAADEVRAEIENLFSGAGRRTRPPAAQGAEPIQAGQRTARKTGKYNIARLACAWHTVNLSHPDAPALDVLAVIAGGGKSSRLERQIKENKKIAFNIAAWSWTPKDPGLFGINADFDPAKEEELLKAIEEEVAGWRANTFTAAEVEKARNKIAADTFLAFQTVGGQADTFASGEFYAGTPLYFDIYLKRLDAVTPAALKEAAGKYLVENNRTIAVLSPVITNAAAEKSETEIKAEINIVKKTFPNGLTFLAREDNRLPFVHICAASLGGLLLENEQNSGITCLTAEMLTRGTALRSRDQISAAAENTGGALAPFSGMNACGLQARCFAKDVELFMDILADCFLRPDFPDAEINKCKAVQIAGIEQQRESPMFLAQEAMRRALFAGHPYRLNAEGTPESVTALAREDLRGLHKIIAAGGNTVIAVFGDISAEKAEKLAEKYFGEMPAGPRQDRPTPGDVATGTRSGKKIDLAAPREQTIILAGLPGLALVDGRMDALNIILQALNGLSSDLMIRVRDQKGLAYYTGAYQRAGLAGGLMAVYSGTRVEEAERVRAMIATEINRIGEKGIRAGEFERARLQIVMKGRQKQQDNGALARECALNELYGLGYNHGIETEKRLAELTPADVRKTAAEILCAEKMVVVTVKPEK